MSRLTDLITQASQLDHELGAELARELRARQTSAPSGWSSSATYPTRWNCRPGQFVAVTRCMCFRRVVRRRLATTGFGQLLRCPQGRGLCLDHAFRNEAREGFRFGGS